MKLIFALLLCSIAFQEVLIDWFFYYRKKVEDNHALTMMIRFAVMGILSWINPSVELWRSALLAFSFHLLFFPVLYNRIVLKKPFDYLSPKVWTDRLEQKIRNLITTPGVFGFKCMLLGSAIKFYIDKYIY